MNIYNQNIDNQLINNQNIFINNEEPEWLSKLTPSQKEIVLKHYKYSVEMHKIHKISDHILNEFHSKKVKIEKGRIGNYIYTKEANEYLPYNKQVKDKYKVFNLIRNCLFGPLTMENQVDKELQKDFDSYEEYSKSSFFYDIKDIYTSYHQNPKWCTINIDVDKSIWNFSKESVLITDDLDLLKTFYLKGFDFLKKMFDLYGEDETIEFAYSTIKKEVDKSY